jgi:O-succinylbenzoate synthase
VRIEGFDLYRYDLALSKPVTLKGITLHRREGALIRLTSEDGYEGWGEAAPLPNFSTENLIDTIEQLRVTAPEFLGHEVSASLVISDNTPLVALASLTPAARFGLEVALLSLRAACRGGGLSDLLADVPTESVHTNGLISGSIESVLAEAIFMRKAGYRAVKLKVGRRRVREDVEIVQRVGEALGGGVSLRLDANRAWGYGEALEFAREISGTRIEYVEEPLSAPARLGELRREWGLPVALDESLVGMGLEDLGQHAYARAIGRRRARRSVADPGSDSRRAGDDGGRRHGGCGPSPARLPQLMRTGASWPALRGRVRDRSPAGRDNMSK